MHEHGIIVCDESATDKLTVETYKYFKDIEKGELVMKLNLSSQIVLNQIPEEFYRPATAIERSEITRFEKVPTDIFPTIEEGAIDIC